MNAVKIILYSMIGTLLAFTIMNAKAYLQNQYFRKNNDSSIQTSLEPRKISFTIKNGSDKRMVCANMINGKPHIFLTLNEQEERKFEEINEGENIGCSLNINDHSSTGLRFINVTEKVYTATLERVPCPTCGNGITESWATIIK